MPSACTASPWPAIFTELGVLTNRRIIRVLERLELAAYAAADEVVVVSDGFRDNLIGRGVPPTKVHTIRNGVSLDGFDPGARPDPALREHLGAAPGDCVVLCAGTHGISRALPARTEPNVDTDERLRPAARELPAGVRRARRRDRRLTDG